MAATDPNLCMSGAVHCVGTLPLGTAAQLSSTTDGHPTPANPACTHARTPSLAGPSTTRPLTTHLSPSVFTSVLLTLRIVVSTALMRET